MQKRLIMLGSFFGFLTLTYGLVVALDIVVLLAPAGRLHQGGAAAIALTLCLLAADTFLPTPSTVVLLAAGYLYGVVGGSILALTGLMLGNAAGFLVARYAHRWLQRKFPVEKRPHTSRFLQRWGAWALVVSRPVPVLAESILLLSATTSLPFGKAMGYCLLGNLPFVIAFVSMGHFAWAAAEWMVTLSLVALAVGVVVSVVGWRRGCHTA